MVNTKCVLQRQRGPILALILITLLSFKKDLQPMEYLMLIAVATAALVGVWKVVKKRKTPATGPWYASSPRKEI